jgi:hypothetical protein
MQKTISIKLVWAAVALVLVFSACSNPAGPGGSGNPDDPAIKAAITEAESLINWVTVAADTAGADDAAVEAARTKLANAISAFEDALTQNGAGTKESGFTADDLALLKTRAEAAKAGVLVSENGDDVSPAAFWVNQVAMDYLNDAIEASETTTGSMDADYIVLNSAVVIFNRVV